MTDHHKHALVLHGLGLNKYWMTGYTRMLRRAGYVVHNLGYPSTRKSVRALTDNVLVPFVQKLPETVSRLDVITHSMGGIIFRDFMARYGFNSDIFGRAVMLAPPNQGSQAADILRDFPPYKWYFGPAGQDLTTDMTSYVLSLPPINFECGIIAGNRHFLHLYFGYKLPKPNDGLVTVENTKCDGMTDHIVLPVDHSLILINPKAIRQSRHFLEQGVFNPL